MTAPSMEMTGTQMRSAIAAFVKAWNDHDVEAIMAKTTTDVVWASANAPGPARVAHGREAAAADVRAGLAALPDMQMATEDLHIFTTDDASVGFSTWTTTGTMTGPLEGMAPTGKSARVRGVCQYKFRDGLIAEHTMVYDRMDMCQQLGLLPYEEDLGFKALAQVQRLSRKTRKVLHI